MAASLRLTPSSAPLLGSTIPSLRAPVSLSSVQTWTLPVSENHVNATLWLLWLVSTVWSLWLLKLRIQEIQRSRTRQTINTTVRTSKTTTSESESSSYPTRHVASPLLPTISSSYVSDNSPSLFGPGQGSSAASPGDCICCCDGSLPSGYEIGSLEATPLATPPGTMLVLLSSPPPYTAMLLALPRVSLVRPVPGACVLLLVRPGFSGFAI